VNDIELNDLDNEELMELLATLEGMDDELKNQEEVLKGDNENNENEL